MSAFDEICRRAATEFLQTVVIVDNMAEYSAPAQDTLAGDLIEPDMFASVAAADEDGDAVADKTAEISLDAGVISRSFADAGLICSILRPSAQEQLENEVLSAATRADILVLDWQMNDEGALATRIVRRLVEQDEAAGGRLRLIAIYTGQSPLAPVREQLKEGFPRLEIPSDGFALVCGNTKVIFLTKAAASVAPGEAGLSVEVDALASRLVQEFAAFAGGLLPNAVLAAIAGIRRHTHKVLARFDKSMDGPFLTHRALVQTPMDAEQFAATLITAELEAQVPLDRIANEYLGEGRVREYVEHRILEGMKPRLMLDKAGKNLFDLDLDRTCRVIEEGMSAFTKDEVTQLATDKKIQKPDTLYDSLRNNLHERLYTLVDADVETGKTNHERFAIAAKIKRDASSVDAQNPDKSPKLRLGSIVVDDAGDHWLCITPLCDSERIPADGGRFMFAHLSRTDEHGEFLIEDGMKVIRLSPLVKRIRVITHVFVPDDQGVVRAALADGVPSFTSKADPPAPWSEPVRLRWLGELKPLQAQRFATQFANSLSRIGLDDFEWHRKRQPDAD
jgi:hypothetical protein